MPVDHLLEKRFRDDCGDDSLVEQLSPKTFPERGNGGIRITYAVVRPCVGFRC